MRLFRFTTLCFPLERWVRGVRGGIYRLSYLGEIESRIFIIVAIFNDLENLDYVVNNFDVI